MKSTSNWKSFLARTFAVIGTVLAVFCSVEISALPMILLLPYLKGEGRLWIGYAVWIVSYLVVVNFAVKLSRMRFGVVAILIATFLVFAIGELLIPRFAKEETARAALSKNHQMEAR